MVRPLRFEDGALLVLDQRRLPAEETWLRCERPEQVAEAIRTLAVRGAPAIGLAAAYGLALAGDDEADAAAELLRGTRPTAVKLSWARLTAWELEHDGIPYRIVVDASAGALMARGLVDRIVVGADRVAANGDVANKVGTYPLAVLATRHGVPFYVAAPVSTLDPGTASGDEIQIEERDPSEVADGAAPEGSATFNPAFDVTAELVDAIFTEAGVLEPPYPDSIAAALGGR